MPKITKVIHTSDLHLGTTFKVLGDKSKIITLAEEIRYSQGKGRQWAKEFIDLFFSLEEFNHGGDNPFNLEDDTEYNE